MKAEINWRNRFLLLGLAAICSAVVVFTWVICQPHVDQLPIDKAKLSLLRNAVYAYNADYGELPRESEFKSLLLKHDLVADETIFCSTPSGVQFRYFTSADHFVLVGPGANDSYDTPEGYHNIEASKDKGDDVVRFGKVPRSTVEAD